MSMKHCPKCGDSFRCEGENDCWCEAVPIHRPAMIEIMEKYTDCLCPSCLGEYAAEE